MSCISRPANAIRLGGQGTPETGITSRWSSSTRSGIRSPSKRRYQHWIKRFGADESGDNYLDTHRCSQGIQHVLWLRVGCCGRPQCCRCQGPAGSPVWAWQCGGGCGGSLSSNIKSAYISVKIIESSKNIKVGVYALPTDRPPIITMHYLINSTFSFNFNQDVHP